MDDPTILQWAADQRRLLVSRDARTIPAFADRRIKAGLVMPGALILGPAMSLGSAIDDLALIAAVTDEQEWADRIVYLPLR